LLPIDIGQYGEFEHDELEIRVCNDFIEVSGKQDWRMVAGGANKRMFAQRHVLPDHIDLKAIYCRLLDSKTILVSAPSLSFVSKLTNTNQLKVDYILGLDSKGLQFLKRYNSTSNSTLTSLNQIVRKSPTLKEKTSSKAKSDQQMTNSVANLLFGIVNKPSRGNSNLSSSKLFTTEQGQKNVNFVNNMKNKEMKSNHKIYLDVNQLMKNNTDEQKRSSKKSKSQPKLEQTSNDSNDLQTNQATAKKSKRRRSKKKKSSEQSTAGNSTVDVETKENAAPQTVVTKDSVDEVKEKAEKKDEATASTTKSSGKKKSIPRRKKDTSVSSTGGRKRTESSTSVDDKKKNDQNDESKESKSNKKQEDWAVIKKDDLAIGQEDTVSSTAEIPKEERVKISLSSSLNDKLVKSQTSKDSTKSAKTGIKGSISSYFTNLLAGTSTTPASSSDISTSSNESSVEEKSIEQPLVSCLKNSKEHTDDNSIDSKKEKHVVIALSDKQD